MTESRDTCIKRQRFYVEALFIPPTTPEGTCRDCSKNAFNMLATTFGIAISGRIFTNPFPAIATVEVKNMWGKNDNEEEDS